MKNYMPQNLIARKKWSSSLETQSATAYTRRNNLNKHISIKENWSRLLITYNRNTVPDRFTSEFYLRFKGNMIPIICNSFQNLQSKGALPNSFYEARITLEFKPEKDAADYQGKQ